MLACAGVGYLLGRSRGMGLQGFFFGLAFGPLGWALVMLWPTSWIMGPLPREGAGPSSGPGAAFRPGSPRRDAGHASPQGRRRSGCPRCGRPAEPGAAACGHCGNVLVPIRYAVEDGDSRPS
jgi:hypothetical protein